MKSFAIVGTWPTLISFFHGISAVTEEGVQKAASAISINDRIFGKTPFFIGLILFDPLLWGEKWFFKSNSQAFSLCVGNKEGFAASFHVCYLLQSQRPKRSPNEVFMSVNAQNFVVFVERRRRRRLRDFTEKKKLFCSILKCKHLFSYQTLQKQKLNVKKKTIFLFLLRWKGEK